MLERLAEVAVRVGANVQPGQVVSISSELGKEELTRLLAAAAYRAGARYVDVTYFDVHVKRARLLHAPEETLDYVPPWLGQRLLSLGELRGARLSLAGPVAPGVLDDVDQRRAGRDVLPWLPEIMTLINERSTNWCVVPCPTGDWARLVFPDLEPAAAYDRLLEQLAHVCRLDADDPAEAWRERMDVLEGVAARLTDRRFRALRFEGPGTDLTVGLLPSSRWASATFSTAEGIPHLANLPSEEVFTSPDPERTEGTVRSTKPLVLDDGTIVRDLVVRFEGGRAVDVRATSGADVIRGRMESDDGAARLGEVALVDREGRIGRLGTVFYDTLLDENAASHVAVGNGFAASVDVADAPRINRSSIHIDFMIGGDEVDVTGLTAEGESVPVLRGGAWQI